MKIGPAKAGPAPPGCATPDQYGIMCDEGGGGGGGGVKFRHCVTSFMDGPLIRACIV